MGLLGDIVKTADPVELRDALRGPVANVVDRAFDRWREEGGRWRRVVDYFARDDVQRFAETLLEEAVNEAKTL
jgi:hypothetical protein